MKTAIAYVDLAHVAAFGEAEYPLAVNALRLRANARTSKRRHVPRDVGGLPSGRFLVPLLLREAAHPDLLAHSTQQITTSLNRPSPSSLNRPGAVADTVANGQEPWETVDARRFRETLGAMTTPTKPKARKDRTSSPRLHHSASRLTALRRTRPDFCRAKQDALRSLGEGGLRRLWRSNDI